MCVFAANTPTATQSPVVSDDTSAWQIYRSETFGYEIRYPPGFEAVFTGPESDRDGAAIRIGLKEFAAAAPVLRVSVGPRIGRGMPANPAGLTVVERDAVINGARFREMTYRWSENGEVAFVELRHAKALLVVDAAPGTNDIYGTVWWSIISTFAFVNAR